MEMILTQVGNFGFPMVVAIYLLVRVEKKLDELTIAINELGRVVEKNVS
ncbi:MAG: ribonuclease Z [Desulfitibacter sp. BRH_c19]|nr:MAG: ribonuclease Z [Desulfitibacter sp. BRH_c19]